MTQRRIGVSHTPMEATIPPWRARAFGAHALWYLGYPDRASKQSQDAVTFARGLSHPPSLMHALSHAALHHQFHREARLAQEHAQAAIDLSTQHGSEFFMAHAAISQGWALASQGHPDQGILEIKQGMAAYRATGSELERTLFLAMLADALLGCGSLGEADAVLTEAMSGSEQTGVHFHLAELHRLQGEAFLGMSNGSRDRAESCFDRALRIARDQKAKSLELRAAISLARLWRNQGKHTDAYGVLAPVYAWFTKGFEKADLQEAKVLVDAISYSRNAA